MQLVFSDTECETLITQHFDMKTGHGKKVRTNRCKRFKTKLIFLSK